MSTRWYIGIKRKNNIKIAYEHWDGYLENAGVKCYNSKVEEVEDFINNHEQVHNFKSIEELKEFLKDSWCEYIYLFDVDNSEWLYSFIEYPSGYINLKSLGKELELRGLLRKEVDKNV